MEKSTISAFVFALLGAAAMSTATPVVAQQGDSTTPFDSFPDPWSSEETSDSRPAPASPPPSMPTRVAPGVQPAPPAQDPWATDTAQGQQPGRFRPLAGQATTT